MIAEFVIYPERRHLILLVVEETHPPWWPFSAFPPEYMALHIIIFERFCFLDLKLNICQGKLIRNYWD